MDYLGTIDQNEDAILSNWLHSFNATGG